ncbi:TonB-dependent receptor [Pleionea sp. CnH1-48]|uniref:TonB-dependent receptor n=1 Tax=Pleionea sp. CnH1-48 TaxID=2954494 RepID=UPI002097CD32|nr:TonB-dependent receptor [Pleionea sp. CnH1-48]MCO7225149.1 TonB-dependent receptor [Pleionea sp. CnH1-48]
MYKLSLALMSFSSLVIADVEQLTESKEDGYVTVTGSRKEALDLEQALSVEAIDFEQLKKDSQQHIAESLNGISGVLLNQLQGSQGHNTAIRMPINYQGYYLFLQDSIPIQSSAFFNHNALWWSSFNSSANRLEVQKGNGTAIYGSGAVAGVVNVLSRPVPDSPEAAMAVSLGENSYRKISANYGTGSDKQGVRTSLSYLRNEGWREHTASERAGMTFRHEYSSSSESHWTTLITLSDLRQEMAASLSAEQIAIDPYQSGLSSDVLATDPERTSQYVRLSTQYDRTQGDFSYSIILYVRHRSNNYTATWRNNLPKVESEVDTFGLLLQSSWMLSKDSDLTMGTDIEVSEGDMKSYQPITITTTGWGGATYPAGHIFYDDSTRFVGISPYIQLDSNLSDHWRYSIGGRYDDIQYDFDNHLAPLDNDGFGNRRLADRKNKLSHFSPKASLLYTVDDSSIVYWRYADGFRMPTAGELYHLKSADTSNFIDQVNEETSQSLEMGYKLERDDISFDVAAYYMDVDDAIVRAYDDFGQSYQRNAGRVIHKGFELGLRWQVTSSTKFVLAHSRSKHQFDDYILDEGRVDGSGNSRAVNVSGNSLPLAPDSITNIRVSYEPDWSDDLSMQWELQMIDDYWMDDINSEEYQGYQVHHLKLRKAIGQQWHFKINLVNAFDKQYEQQAEIRYGRTRLQPGTPRQIYVGLEYQWH